MILWQKAILAAGRAAFDPASFFTNGIDGAFHLVTPSTCFVDVDGLTAAGIGDTVLRLNDVSGNGHHLVQPNAAAAPVLQQDAGGMYYLDAPGAQWMETANIDIASQHFFLAADRINPGSWGGFITSVVDGPSGREIEFVFNCAENDVLNWRAVPGISAPQNDRYRRNGLATISIGSGGAVYSTDTTGYTNSPKHLRGIALGRDRGLNRYPNFRFYGQLCIDRVLSDPDRDKVEQFFGSLVGVSL